MNAVVVFSSRFGTTEKIARSLERGLREANAQTTCTDVRSVAPESLKSCDLVCIGGPTEMFGASKPMKEFLKDTKGTDLSGKLGFAFDTKLDSRMSGSAAKYIEHALDDLGVRIIAPRESALVTNQKTKGQITGATLKEGEEGRFEKLGLLLGAMTAEEMAKLSSYDQRQA
jgi:flavodoxin